ncbi:MAG: DUF6624 domain-containing protein [Saprospiraceae bacterium]
MRQLLILFLLLFIFLSISFAQTSGELVARADSLYRAKDYQASGEMYDLAFAQHEGASSALYNAACSWALAGDADRALNYIERTLAAGWNNDQWMLQDSDLKLIQDNVLFKKMLEPLTVERLKREAQYNQPLKKQLEAIEVRDQTLRLLLGDVSARFGRDSEHMDYFTSIMHEKDSINEMEVINIIEKHGWLGKSEVGSKANNALWLVIQHAPLATQEKYIPLLRESVANGESEGSQLALTEDRIRMYKGEKQIYGSQVKRDQETGKFYVCPVIDPYNVNTRRAEVGLQPIEQYVMQWNITWNPATVNDRE